jgi:hypothetical protein
MVAPHLGRLVYYLDRGDVAVFGGVRFDPWRVAFSSRARLKGRNVGNAEAHADLISIA